MPFLARFLFGIASVCLMAATLLPHTAWCQKPTAKAPVAFRADAQLIYKTLDGKDLSLFLYQPKGWSPGGKRPALVYLHGGGWAGGTLHQGMDLLTTTREHGVIGINVEYRLADAQNLDPARCIEDAKSAVRFIRAKAQLLGIDPDRIAVGGHSAGGHLAAACALLPTFNAASDDLRFSCKPNALALIVPVLDNGPDRGYKSEAPAIKSNLHAYSPAHNVSTGAPPTLILAGNQDAGAALSCLERFKQNMIRSGNRCELVVYEGGHGFANQSPVKEEVNGRIVDFIRSLGWLDHKSAAIPSSAPTALASPSQAPETPLSLATIFTDHMVLQRDAIVPVWGWATPASRVTVEFAGQVKTATTDASGKWRVTLDPLSASAEPRSLKVRGSDPEKGEATLTREDVVVGEVWFCSGQSNMETALGGNPELPIERDLPTNPQLRAFVFRKAYAQTAQEKIPEGRWLLADSKSRSNFYAVAYFFGKNVESHLKVPVGLIQSAWGGTPVQAWTSREMLATDPEMNAIAEAGLQQYRDGLQSNQRFLAENGDPQKLPWPEWQNAKTPSFLFNAMVHPFIPYGIRGVIWYQGEHNVSAPWPYAKMFTAMIRDWRARWGLGDFPFHFCQLPGLKLTAANMTGNLAILRAMQAKALELPNTGMAVLYDTAEEADNHPKDKRTAGERLARLVLRQTFGHPIECDGPTYAGMSVQGNQVVVHFQHVGSGLVAREIPATYQPIRSKPETKPVVRMSPDSPLEGFQVRDRNGSWQWARARIVGQTVVVQSENVPQPFAVRYGWSDFGFFNLFNEAGFPAPPFSSEPLPAQPPASTPAP
jgi:sialate O-acetylesterase